MRLLFVGAFFIQTTHDKLMSSYIYIKNFYLEEIQTIIQDYFNTNYTEESQLVAEILMKNSRTYFIQFNEDLAIEELLDWMNSFHLNQSKNDRTTLIEGYLSMPPIEYRFYFLNEEIYAVSSQQKSFKVEDLEELIPIENNGIEFTKTELPHNNIHSMSKIQFLQPQKKWWKFW